MQKLFDISTMDDSVAAALRTSFQKAPSKTGNGSAAAADDDDDDDDDDCD